MKVVASAQRGLAALILAAALVLESDGAKAYRVSMTYTPERDPGDHMCVGCFGGTSGECRHLTSGICFPYADADSHTCEPGLHRCFSPKSKDGKCGDCLGDTQGSCQHEESKLCFDYHHAEKELECEDGLRDCAWGGQLSLDKGTFVVVPKHQDVKAKWWTVISETNHKGLFPSAYLVPGEMASDEEEEILSAIDAGMFEDEESGDGDGGEEEKVATVDDSGGVDTGSSAFTISAILFVVVAVGIGIVIRNKKNESAAFDAKNY